MKDLKKQREADIAEDHYDILEAFDIELNKTGQQKSDSQQNASFFAGIVVAIIAIIVS